VLFPAWMKHVLRQDLDRRPGRRIRAYGAALGHAQLAFLPEARGWHHVRRSFSSWLKVPEAYGLADAEMARQLQPAPMAYLGAEFRSRHRTVRILARLCAGRPHAMATVQPLLAAMVLLANYIPESVIDRPACSLLFNLQYYHGMVRGLGGRNAWMRLIEPTGVGAGKHQRSASTRP